MKKLIYSFAILLLVLNNSCEKEDLKEDLNLNCSQTVSGILFLSWRIENSEKWNLCIMNKDGSEQKKVTDLTVKYGKPILSHSNKNVLFVHYTEDHFYELYSICIVGSNITLIDRAKRYCGSADWSKDDTKIIYSKNRDDSTDEKDIILLDIVTNISKTLTSTGNNISAKFSINDKITYSHYIDNQWNIYTMGFDGNNKKLIIPDAYDPVWSPDGSKIAYQSRIDNGSSQIFVSNSDGTNQKKLTNSSYPPGLSGWPLYGKPPHGNSDPNWTSDGKKIVYVSWEDGDPDIHIMNTDGSSKIKLTNTVKRDEHPEITADGKFVLFSSKRNMNMETEIFIMDIDGKNQNPLTNYYGRDTFPVEVNE